MPRDTRSRDRPGALGARESSRDNCLQALFLVVLLLLAFLGVLLDRPRMRLRRGRRRSRRTGVQELLQGAEFLDLVVNVIQLLGT